MSKQDQPELVGMPARKVRVRTVFKLPPAEVWVDEAPELGDAVRFPSATVGEVTKVVHSRDKEGELWVRTVERMGAGNE